MIHSIVSLSDILFNGEAYPKAEYKQIKGGLLEIENYGGQKRVKRLISTDPALYLDKRYEPRTICNVQ